MRDLRGKVWGFEWDVVIHQPCSLKDVPGFVSSKRSFPMRKDSPTALDHCRDLPDSYPEQVAVQCLVRRQSDRTFGCSWTL